ncbi:hypothetical protein KUTeg_016951 [Tegillarca granosa]|uniref:EH domain-containing protein n=1 Tax=Tegillarca granosa TaxID=220873 RepID=A0ABQ9EPX7_TEGGR|nr:hypothetical protein KUTeg_016951 [Tegillarca granosa]
MASFPPPSQVSQRLDSSSISKSVRNKYFAVTNANFSCFKILSKISVIDFNLDSVVSKFQIAGSHIGVYEAYYKQADPNNTGSIGALDAATFLKKSGLKDTVLSQVFTLKLIALSQSGQELSISKLTAETPAPNLGPVEVITEPVAQNQSQSIPWIVTATEKQKYDQVFDSLLPVNGLLSGDKVKPVLMNSKLPTDAMHFVYKALEKEPVPTTLPLKLIPPSKRNLYLYQELYQYCQ